MKLGYKDFEIIEREKLSGNLYIFYLKLKNTIFIFLLFSDYISKIIRKTILNRHTNTDINK
jgi:hypothetical protein